MVGIIIIIIIIDNYYYFPIAQPKSQHIVFVSLPVHTLPLNINWHLKQQQYSKLSPGVDFPL